MSSSSSLRYHRDKKKCLNARGRHRTLIHPLPLTTMYRDHSLLRRLQIVSGAIEKRGKDIFSTNAWTDTQYSYHCHLGLASNVSSSVSLGEINFPLFVERTVETREDDITGCFHSRCYRGRNSLGLKQDNAVPGDTVSDGAKSVIFD